MSTHEHHNPDVPGPSLEETREQVLARGRPLPPHDEMIIEGLTDEEEKQFLAAIADA